MCPKYPSKSTSMTYATGDAVTVEATALTALAMIRTGQFTNSANQALTFLIKSKAGNGTWGSTSATILSLKALVAGMGNAELKDDVAFTIKVKNVRIRRGPWIGAAGEAGYKQREDGLGHWRSGVHRIPPCCGAAR